MMKGRSETLTVMDRVIAREIMREAFRATYKGMGDRFPETIESFRIHPWCDMLLVEIAALDAILAYRGVVVRLPEPPRRQPHGPSLWAVGNELVSTLELRMHAFAAYAAAMALHGPDDAMDQAVAETLRRRPNWSQTVAVRHTRKFIIPAYQRAFPGDHEPRPSGDDEPPRTPGRRAA